MYSLLAVSGEAGPDHTSFKTTLDYIQPSVEGMRDMLGGLGDEI